MEYHEDELLPVTTYVPRRLVAAFQQSAAEWVAGADAAERLGGDRVPSDRRPDWTAGELGLAQHIARKMASDSVAIRALSVMAMAPGQPLQGGQLAVKLGLAQDEHDLKGARKIAGCWGHVGRYCVQAGKELPFQWNEEAGYWVTEGTAAVLIEAGLVASGGRPAPSRN